MTPRPAPDWLTAWEYAHRGLHHEGVPENSLAGAEGAIAAGMGIECDIQRSRDDHPMVFHDWELERLTGKEGETEHWTAEALEVLSLLGTDQRPVRLATFLEKVAGRAALLIEIKSLPGYDVEWTCASVAWLLDTYSGAVAVMSFDPRVPRWFMENAPQVMRGLLMGSTLCWASHNLIVGSVCGLTCDCLGLIGFSLALLREYAASRRATPALA